MSVDFVRHDIEHAKFLRVKARPLWLGSMTTAQRNLLPAINGLTIYNSTTNQFEFYQAGAWRTFTPVAPPTPTGIPVDIGIANAIGADLVNYVRRDHVHAHPAFGAGILPNPHDHSDIAGVTFGQHHTHYARMIKSILWGEQILYIGTNVLYLIPLQIPYTSTISELGWVSSLAVNYKIGIWNDNGDTPAGGALLAGSGAQAGVGISKNEWTLVAPIQLAPGLYWVGVVLDTAGNQICQLVDEATGGTLTPMSAAQPFANPLPNPCPAVAFAARVPNQYVIVSSVP